MAELYKGTGKRLEPFQERLLISNENQARLDTMGSLAGEFMGEPYPVGSDYNKALEWARVINQQENQRAEQELIEVLKSGVQPEEAVSILEMNQPNADSAIERNAARMVVDSLDTSSYDIDEEIPDYTDRTYQEELTLEGAMKLEKQAMMASDEEATFGETAASLLVPGWQDETIQDVAQAIFGDSFIETVETGENIQRLRDYYWRQLTGKDQDRVIEEFNAAFEKADVTNNVHARRYFWQALQAYTEQDALDDTFVGFFDAATTAADVATIGGITGLKVVGKGVSRISAAKVAQGLGRSEVAAKEGDIIHPVLNIDVDPGNSGAPGLAADIEDTLVPRIYTEDELNAAVPEAIDRLKNEVDRGVRLRSGNFASIKWDNIRIYSEINSDKGYGRVHALIGAGNGKTEFVDEATAEFAKEQMGLLGGKIVPGNGGGFFIQVTQDVQPLQVGIMKFDPLEGTVVPWLRKNVNTADYLTDAAILNEFRHLGTDALTTFAEKLNEIHKPVSKWKRKNPKDHEELNKVMIKGLQTFDAKGNQGVWFSKDDFVRTYQGRDVEGAWTAYQTYRKLDEMDYVMRNRSIRNRLVADGYNKVQIGADDIRVMKEIADTNNEVVVYGTNKTKRWSDLKGQGYRLFLDADPTRSNRYVAVKDVDAEVSALPDFVLNRTEGGRINYSENQFFAEIPRIGSDGVQYRGTTIAGGSSKEAGEKFVSRFNEAVDALVRLKNGDIKTQKQADAIIQAAMSNSWKAASASQFEKMIKGFKILKKDANGWKAEKVQLRPEGLRVRPDDPDAVLDEVYLYGNIFTSPRTNRLLGSFVDENPAPMMDPWAAQVKAMRYTFKTEGTAEYSRRLFETFRHNAIYGQAGNILKPSAKTMSAEEIFRNTPYIERMTEQQRRMMNRLEVLKDIHERSFNAATGFDRWWEETVMAKVFRVDPDMRDAEKLEWARTMNPVKLGRSLMFKLNLGAFSPRQLILQASSIGNVVAISPRAGFKAVTQMPTMMVFLTRPDMAKPMAKMMSKKLGTKADDLYNTFEDLYRSGKWRVGGEVAELGLENNANVLKNAPPAWSPSNLWDKQAVFFTTGERMNRVTGWLAAYNERLAKGLGRPRNKDDFAQLNYRADVLTNRMTTASSSKWNEGVLSIPTQFMNFQYRWVEALTGKTLKGPEKWRLGLANFIGLGAGGAVGGSLAMEMGGLVYELTGGNEEAAQLMSYGVLDSSLNFLLTSLDKEPHNIDFSQFGPQFATNEWFRQAMGAIRGSSEEGNMYEVLFGPSASLIKGTSENIGNFMTHIGYAWNKNDPEYAKIAMKDVGFAIIESTKTGRDLVKAYMILKYQTDRSFRGTLAADGVDSEDALLAALGMQRKDVSNKWNAIDIIRMEEAAYKDGVKALQNLWQVYVERDASESWASMDAEEFQKRWVAEIEKLPVERQGEAAKEALMWASRRGYPEKAVEKIAEMGLTDE